MQPGIHEELDRIRKEARKKEREEIIKKGKAMLEKYNHMYTTTALKEFINSL